MVKSCTFLGLLASLGRLHWKFFYIWAVRIGRAFHRLASFISNPIFPLLLLQGSMGSRSCLQKTFHIPGFHPSRVSNVWGSNIHQSNSCTQTAGAHLKTNKIPPNKNTSHLWCLILGVNLVGPWCPDTWSGIIWWVPLVAQWKWIRLVSKRMRVRSLASLTGSGIRCCRELWCRSQIQLGFSVAVAMASVGIYSSDLT